MGNLMAARSEQQMGNHLGIQKVHTRDFHWAHLMEMRTVLRLAGMTEYHWAALRDWMMGKHSVKLMAGLMVAHWG